MYCRAWDHVQSTIEGLIGNFSDIRHGTLRKNCRKWSIVRYVQDIGCKIYFAELAEQQLVYNDIENDIFRLYQVESHCYRPNNHALLLRANLTCDSPAPASSKDTRISRLVAIVSDLKNAKQW